LCEHKSCGLQNSQPNISEGTNFVYVGIEVSGSFMVDAP